MVLEVACIFACRHLYLLEDESCEVQIQKFWWEALSLSFEAAGII